MNFEYFIAKRLIKGKEHKSSISTPIIKIAIFAIALGMVMMLITIATGVGLQKKIREKVAAFNGHIVVSSYDNNQSIESLVPIDKNESFYPEFSSLEGIAHVQGVATKAGIIRTASDFEGIVVKGVGADYDWSTFEEYLVEGKIPDYDTSHPVNTEILISKHIADRLQLSIGDKANTYFLKKGKSSNPVPNIRSFVVTGIYSSGFQEFDEVFVLCDIRHIQRLNKWKENEIGNFEIFIDNFEHLEEKGVEVNETIYPVLYQETIASKYETIFEWLKLFDLNIIGIIAIIILVAGINMITALLVLILERTPMIGILKALGSSDWSIRKVFLYNAAYLIMIGLFWGNLIGLGLLWIQKLYGVIKLNPETYYVSTAPVHIDIGYVLLLNLGTLLLCLIMLLIPSYIVSKVSPVKAIRFE
ncbi:ABC transporter permease [Aquimarina hainanensis]|uniref:ABC transporter permease n=1 Tax=Aquimarina hainanensis TaxID=1578017 RepID=A0ABW5N8H1_9FLAO|nr:FtsX-like permease family protein [Aquimarina sp. TRL1]QKX05635.1 ABC transporter permease [Aquimarina sp. TRL1]